MPTAAFYTLGCKVNQAETRRLAEALRGRGWQIVDHKNQASVYVINSCAVTAESARKTRQAVRRFKKNSPEAKIALIGCMPSVADNLGEELPEADIILRQEEKDSLPEALDSLCREKDESCLMRSSSVTDLLPGDARRAAVKIQDGCDRFCSYCVIPLARGRARSVPAEEVLSECRSLLAGGVREIILTGINLCAWGREELIINNEELIINNEQPINSNRQETNGGEELIKRKEKPTAGNGKLRIEKKILTDAKEKSTEGDGLLIIDKKQLTGDNKQLIFSNEGLTVADILYTVNKLPGLLRLRLGSLEPDLLTYELLEKLVRIKKLCPHFHLSLQSGSDGVLRRMNRRYSTARFAEICANIRALFPDCTITTDIIAGFPGETDAEFAETLAFAREIAFEKVHVFPYSARPGTRAAEMPGQLPRAVKERRARELIRAMDEIRQAFLRAQIGKTVELLPEETDAKGYMRGYTGNYIPTRVKHEPFPAGLVKVEITGVSGDYCVGRF